MDQYSQIINRIDQMVIIYDCKKHQIIMTNNYTKDHITYEFVYHMLERIDFKKEYTLIEEMDISVYIYPVESSSEIFFLIGQQMKDQLIREQSFDAITQLPSMDYFFNYAQMVVNDNAHQHHFAIIHIRVQLYKRLNDNVTYSSNDDFYRYISHIITHDIQNYMASRFSQNHFIVLTDQENIEEKLEIIREKLRNYNNIVSSNVRMGIYMMSQEDLSIVKACDKARFASQAIRDSQKEYFQFYDKEIANRIIKERYIIDHIDEAIKNGELQVYYQPVVRVTTGKVAGSEALIRWQNPRYGFMSPAEFIPVLEENGDVYKVDQFVVEQVCRDYNLTELEYMTKAPISINFSPYDLDVFDINHYMNEVTKRYHLPHYLFHIEITESALNKNTSYIIDVIRRLREDGYEVWIDDFGSEYSSFNALHRFDFDTLKIDMKFFQEFETNNKSKEIITSIVDMAKNINLSVVAEGIETFEQLQFLKEIGCDKAQGYYFQKPIPIDQVNSENIPVEAKEEAQYYENTNKVNIFSRDPLKNKDIVLEWDFYGTPLAIIELSQKEFQFIIANDAYRKVLASLHIYSLEQGDDIVNHSNIKLRDQFLDLANKANQFGNEQSIDFIYNNNQMTLKIVKLNSYQDRTSYFVSMVNLSQLTDLGKIDTLNTAIHYLYNIYNRLDLISYEDNKIDNIYLNSTDYEGYFTGESVEKALKGFAQKYIYCDDIEKFSDYYNLSSIDQRIDDLSHEYLTGFFRTNTRHRGYKWQMYIILRVYDNNKKYYLSCVRDVDIESTLIAGYYNLAKKDI